MLTLFAIYSLPVLMLGYLILDIITEKIVRFTYRKKLQQLREFNINEHQLMLILKFRCIHLNIDIDRHS